jgi:hypothetical protein
MMIVPFAAQADTCKPGDLPENFTQVAASRFSGIFPPLAQLHTDFFSDLEEHAKTDAVAKRAQDAIVTLARQTSSEGAKLALDALLDYTIATEQMFPLQLVFCPDGFTPAVKGVGGNNARALCEKGADSVAPRGFTLHRFKVEGRFVSSEVCALWSAEYKRKDLEHSLSFMQHGLALLGACETRMVDLAHVKNESSVWKEVYVDVGLRSIEETRWCTAKVVLKRG